LPSAAECRRHGDRLDARGFTFPSADGEILLLLYNFKFDVAKYGLIVGFLAPATRSVHLPPVATAIVKNASLRIDDCMSYELQPSNITFAEMLAKLQTNVTELDSKLIDLQSAQTAFENAPWAATRTR
jgi:hypothetical protein